MSEQKKLPEELTDDYNIMHYKYQESVATNLKQSATIAALQNKIRVIEQSEQRLMMALHWAGINTGDDLDNFLDNPYPLGKDKTATIAELLEAINALKAAQSNTQPNIWVDASAYFGDDLKVALDRYLRDYGAASKVIDDAIDYMMPELLKTYSITRLPTPPNNQ